MFVALVIEHATCMRRITLSSVAYTALPYFSTLFHERHHFLDKKKCIERNKFDLIFSKILVSNFSHSKKR